MVCTSPPNLFGRGVQTTPECIPAFLRNGRQILEGTRCGGEVNVIVNFRVYVIEDRLMLLFRDPSRTPIPIVPGRGGEGRARRRGCAIGACAAPGRRMTGLVSDIQGLFLLLRMRSGVEKHAGDVAFGALQPMGPPEVHQLVVDITNPYGTFCRGDPRRPN